MLTAAVLNTEKVTVEEIQLQDSVFSAPIKMQAVHDVVCSQLASRRQGTSSTKGRSEVRGGGRKPWRQKGTGNARVGTIRSPLWRGGGTVFGPKPRNYTYSVPKKMRKAALRSVLTSKFQESQLLVVDQLNFEQPSTKRMVAILHNLVGEAGSVLIALGDWTEAAWKSGRNIPGVRVIHAENVNVYTVLQHDYLIVDKMGLVIIEGALES